MRIVGGQWRGRPISAPKGQGTRPTTDRVREAVFDVLTSRMGRDLGGARVLDGFAGSGAMGLEALSRGASHATFVETSGKAASLLRRNVEAMGAGPSSSVVVGDLFSLAARMPGGPFSLLLLDPPYKLDAARIGRALEEMAGSGAIEDGAWVSWEHASTSRTAWPQAFSVETVKTYGGTVVDFARVERGSER